MFPQCFPECLPFSWPKNRLVAVFVWYFCKGTQISPSVSQVFSQYVKYLPVYQKCYLYKTAGSWELKIVLYLNSCFLSYLDENSSQFIF